MKPLVLPHFNYEETEILGSFIMELIKEKSEVVVQYPEDEGLIADFRLSDPDEMLQIATWLLRAAQKMKKEKMNETD